MKIGNQQVTDAFVDWSLGSANTPTLTAFIEHSIDRESVLPLTGEPLDGIYIEELDGLFVGFQEGESFENRPTVSVEHEERGEVTGTWAYHHVVRYTLRREKDIQTAPVTLTAKYPSSYAVSVEKVEELVEYINSDEKETPVAYWFWKNEKNPSKWRRFVRNRDDYDGYTDCRVGLEEDGIYGLKPVVEE